jgi:hypothetical protein
MRILGELEGIVREYSTGWGSDRICRTLTDLVDYFGPGAQFVPANEPKELTSIFHQYRAVFDCFFLPAGRQIVVPAAAAPRGLKPLSYHPNRFSSKVEFLVGYI